ncbi:terminase large subunit [Candidatus Parcubacteria bacterium]|nr:MAG: terminase large subunit [Candidatus Parcubacteria bacterium]
MTKQTRLPFKKLRGYFDRDKYYFDKKEARRAVAFFERELIHIEGECAGQKFKLEPWQYKIVRRFFGWKNRSDNTRKYRVLYIEIPRKNGKSFFASGFALYFTFADRELGAQVVSAAADREQAGIVFNVAKHEVERNPKLKRLANVYKRSITVPSTASSYQVISAEAYTKHGKNLHAFVVDELHAQPNRDLVDVLRTSMGTRKQPAMIFLTTAGYDRNSICYEYHDYAKKVLAGIIDDPTFMPVIYAAGENDDWRSEQTWKKANPNYGVSIKPEFLRSEYKVAAETPAYENTFKRLYLNIWTEQESRWFNMDKWDACNEKVNYEQLQGELCYAGLDLATTQDISALVLYFPRENKPAVVLPYFWLPEAAVKKRTKVDVPYANWVNAGLIEVTPGEITDYDIIRQRINELNELYHIKQIAIDRWNATQLATQLDGDGFDVVLFGQGYKSMSAPAKELLSLILQRKLTHGDNPVLRWMASNVAVEQDAAGNIKPSKKKSKEKIDGIVALVMALGIAAAAKQEQESVYNERGLITF